jgi:hypothetical protein
VTAPKRCASRGPAIETWKFTAELVLPLLGGVWWGEVEPDDLAQ